MACTHRRFLVQLLLAAAAGLQGCQRELPIIDDQNDARAHGSPGTISSSVAQTRPDYRLAKPAPFLRLDIRSHDDTLQLAAIAEVELSIRPLPALMMSHLLIARAGNTVVSVVPLSLSHAARFSRLNTDAGPLHDTVEVSESAAIAFVPAAATLDRVDIVDGSGRVVLAVPSERLAAVQSGRVGVSSQALHKPIAVGVDVEALDAEGLARVYPQIAFLQAGDNAKLPGDLLGDATLVNPSPEAISIIDNVLTRCPPALLSAVRTIAFVKFPLGSQDAKDTGGRALNAQLIINAENLKHPHMFEMIFHELAHTFGDLSNATITDDGSVLKQWLDTQREEALRFIVDFRLARGFEAEWGGLHQTGVELNLAGDYLGEDGSRNITGEEARERGFATNYGAQTVGEDFAEYVGTLLADEPLLPGVCPRFDGEEFLTPALAIPYAKLVLLLSLGLIDDAAFDGCVQRVKIAQESGVHFPGTAPLTGGLRAGEAIVDGNPYFGLVAERSDSYELLVKIALQEPGESALGLHRLDNVWRGNVANFSLNACTLGNDDYHLVRTAARGLVLFTEASAQRTTGVIFGLAFQNVMQHVTDQYSLVTFQVP